jgi:uncharacterized MnhB-related membrane protein
MTLMAALQAALFLLAALAGTAVVLTREPEKQVIVLSFYGMLLSLLFLLLHAPDVAFSELVVGAAAVPFMILVTLSKIREKQR